MIGMSNETRHTHYLTATVHRPHPRTRISRPCAKPPPERLIHNQSVQRCGILKLPCSESVTYNIDPSRKWQWTAQKPAAYQWPRLDTYNMNHATARQGIHGWSRRGQMQQINSITNASEITSGAEIVDSIMFTSNSRKRYSAARVQGTKNQSAPWDINSATSDHRDASATKKVPH